MLPADIIRVIGGAKPESVTDVNCPADERFDTRLEARKPPKPREIHFVLLTS